MLFFGRDQANGLLEKVLSVAMVTCAPGLYTLGEFLGVSLMETAQRYLQ